MGVMSIRVKSTILFLLFLPFSCLAKEPFMSESELVSFLNKNGYSIATNKTQKVSITYIEEHDMWSVNIQALCTKPDCVCIDCETILGVSGTKESPKLAIALDG